MTTLQAKVTGLNKVNAEANRLTKILRDNFRPLIGQKVTKNDGYLLEKFKKLVPETPFQIWQDSGGYSLAYTIKGYETTEKGQAVYSESCIYIGTLRGGILIGISENFENRRTDYSEEGIIEQRKIVAEAEEEFREERAKLSPFDMYDR